MRSRLLLDTHELDCSPIRHQIAAISVGLLEGQVLLDLNYPEDVAAATDCNMVMNENLDLIEIQGTAEEGQFSRVQLNQILDLAEQGIQDLMAAQREVIPAGVLKI